VIVVVLTEDPRYRGRRAARRTVPYAAGVSTTVELPARARVVVIGGGVIGTSIAYHLGHLGWRDTVLVERDRLTSGTTWHAAGLMVTFGSTSETSTALRRYTRDLYARLEAETGLATGFAPVGFVELAGDDDRLVEFRRVAAFDRHCGVDVHEISPREVADLFPLARVDDLRAGFYVPGDGRVNPVDVTMSMARGARQQGVIIAQGVRVLDVVVRDGAARAVVTDHGTIECEHVVNAAGMWARQLGARSGVTIPLQAAEHYYLITEHMDGLDASWPVIEDPASHGYYREEVGGLMVGLFEPVCAPWRVEGVPDDASFTQLPPDWDRMGPYVETAMRRVPRAFDVGIRTFFCGPESFTPDLAPIVGPAPEVRNYWVAAGLNSIGILTGGGLGRLVAHWIADGDPGADVTGMHPARLHPYQATPDYRRTRTVESLGMVYQCHYPNRSMRTARGARRSPLHDRLAAHGAHFRDVSGWEGADWYAGAGVDPDPGPLTWGRPASWPRWEAEHRACRDGVIVMDMSFMAKYRVQGRDAGRVLDHVSANAVDGAPGTITYTPWLDERGLLQADLTVTKLDEGDFLVVATDTAHRHALAHLRRHLGDAHAFAADVTSAYGQLNVQGPRSRELLQSLTSADLGNDAFPFRSAREIDIGFARVLCVRITYLGELGYELYVPTEQTVHVYERIVEAGAPFALRHAGLKALASLRLEKGYRDYGHDIDNTDGPLEAGLGFAVAFDKPGGFVGRDAVSVRRDAGPPTRRLVQVLLRDPEPLLFHAEVVRRDGIEVGYVRAGSYGHTLGGAVGLAMVDGGAEPVTPAWLRAGAWTVDVAGREHPAVASLKPLYDPDGARIRA
jgi:4-methylaminobutanoate oxidase (formaldehyde-forming)